MSLGFLRVPKLEWRLVEHLLSLYGLHAASMLLPLLIWPWLARVAGPVLTGHLAVTEAAARYIGLIVEFGYQFSATREIARSRACPQARSRIVRSVLAGQLLLSAAAIAAFILSVLFFPSLRRHGLLPVTALCWGVSLGLSPAWYFQGSERLSRAASVEVACRFLGVLLVFALVRHPSDAWIAPLLNGLASAVSALLCWRMLLRETAISHLSLREGWTGLVSGFHVFLSRGVVSLYTTANILLLGLLARPEAVGFFAAAEKLAKAGVSVLYPIGQAMYPRIARLLEADPAAARAAALGALKAVVALGALIALGLAGGSRWLMPLLFGPAFAPAAGLLVILSGLAPVIAISNVLGLQWMLPQKMERSLNAILAAGASAGLALALVLTPRFEAAGMACAVLSAEIVISAGIVLRLGLARRGPWLSRKVRQEMASC